MSETIKLFEDIQKTVHDLREAVEAKAGKETIEKIQEHIDNLEVKSQRVNFSNSNVNTLNETEKKELSDFNNYCKKGAISEDMQTKAMSSDSNPDGGYFIPSNMSSQIIERIRKISPVRMLADVVTISAGSDYAMPREKNDPYQAGWVGERQDRPETANDTFEMVKIPVHEMYAQPSITQRLLDDSAFNFENYMAQRVANRFAQLEGAAFVSGDGVNKPKGFLTYDSVQNLTGTVSFDDLIKLVYSLDAEYSDGAVFMAKRTTIRDIRVLKDLQGQYLWQPSTQIGEPATVLGYKIYEADDMPAAGTAGNKFLTFGNFMEGYQIVDKTGIVTLRDPYTSKPFVKFYTTKRTGGGVKNPDAIKILKQS